MNVFDSSALLALVLDEPGGSVVEEQLADPGVCGAANWSEVAQKATARGVMLAATKQWLLADLRLEVEVVTREDAELAAELWRRLPHLSLADRCCLALGTRLGATVWTADRSWGEEPPIRQVR